ncbi:FkbM family methyltransferase [Paraburkholderia sp. BR10923]|uniref:FkbM family methyltransferase n=1 Tax=Paraburkholderia sp. BR10923 TaxID=3236992 RepID=UPI0034CF3E76
MDRDPESEKVIEEKLHCPSIRALADAFMESAEFFDKHPYLVSAKDRWVMVEHKLGFRIWVNTADTAVSWCIIDGDFEPNETDFVMRNVKKGNSVIDIGANLGFFSLLCSKLVGPTGRVIGFEALTFLHESAICSVRENQFDHCIIHNVALASQRGQAQLIYAPGSPNWGGAFLSFDGTGLPDHASVTVPTAPLTDFVGDIHADFIKIDVEGAEHMVLNSCKDYIAQTKPVVMSEIHRGQLARVSRVHPVEYIEFMSSLGYECHEIAAGGHGDLGRAITGHEAFDLINVAFVPK